MTSEHHMRKEEEGLDPRFVIRHLRTSLLVWIWRKTRIMPENRPGQTIGKIKDILRHDSIYFLAQQFG